MDRKVGVIVEGVTNRAMMNIWMDRKEQNKV